EDGGNAIDAAVAVSLVLGVTEPSGSGIGGQSVFIIHPPKQDPFVLNGTSMAPKSIPPGVSMSDLTGQRASTVPSTLRVLDFAWQNYGSGRLDWKQLVEPSMQYAFKGFRLGAFRYRALKRQAKAIRRKGVTTQLLLASDGSVPEEGTLICNPVLGRTLERIGTAGAEDFYRGDIAREIVEDMALNDGWITSEDLAGQPEPTVLPPLKGTYRGWDIYSMPPPASGWVVLFALNILERAPEGDLAVDSPERIVWLAEALKVAHQHRIKKYIPDVSNYRKAVESKLDKAKAKNIAKLFIDGKSGETTHFSVVDGDGMVVGVTQSLNAYFGAKVASPKLGFLYNDYMHEFVLTDDRHPYALSPKAMPYSSMSASIAARNGEPVLVLGSPADERIISSVVQVISHWIDMRKGIEQAVGAPRIHTLPVEEVLMEMRPANPRTLLELEQRGYTVHQPLSSLFSGDLNPYFGGVHACAKQDDDWRGAADPRRDGAVAYAGIKGAVNQEAIKPVNP
ncbi:hypothetical protein C6A37_06670, partial [Desulfobacteraceae bacterium SEEP-SAG9]